MEIQKSFSYLCKVKNNSLTKKFIQKMNVYKINLEEVAPVQKIRKQSKLVDKKYDKKMSEIQRRKERLQVGR